MTVMLITTLFVSFCKDGRGSVSVKLWFLVVYVQLSILLVEEEETNLMSLVIKFYFTSSMLNMFRTLIHPSSGACDFSIVSPHWSCVLVSMCVGVSVWLGWGGIV